MRHTWPTPAGLAQAMFHWIEAFYNPTRRHSTLGYLRPSGSTGVDQSRSVMLDHCDAIALLHSVTSCGRDRVSHRSVPRRQAAIAPELHNARRSRPAVRSTARQAASGRTSDHRLGSVAIGGIDDQNRRR
jgi:hypothetical protein